MNEFISCLALFAVRFCLAFRLFSVKVFAANAFLSVLFKTVQETVAKSYLETANIDDVLSAVSRMKSTKK